MTNQTASSGASADDPIRESWRKAHVAPLWENRAAHRAGRVAPRPHLWRWADMEPLIAHASALKSMEAIERRVLSFVNPEPRYPGDSATITNLNAALQILMPGETARPHRHSMNALRFVLSGGGARTMVNGTSCTMEEGDLVITPGWLWHEHVHEGTGPIVWLDVLDASLHRYLGTDVFEPGPVRDGGGVAPQDAFAVANFGPELPADAGPHSPVFRYPAADAARAVQAAPIGRDGARRVRYMNPCNGGPVMSLLDCHLAQIDPGATTTPFRTTSHAVCAVVQGRGSSSIGDDTISWSARDVFTLPPNSWITHRSEGEPARLFVVSDREVLRRLGLLQDEFAQEAR
jgi:gentisate 1,2-dioxygenase